MKRKIIVGLIILLVFGDLFFLIKVAPDLKFKKVQTDQKIVEKIRPESLVVPILIYHHIDSDLPPKNSQSRTFYVTPAEFEQQLKYLKENNFQAVSTKNLAEAFAGDYLLPKNPVIITFDDGLPSQYLNALPLLEKYGFTATFYIFTNAIGISKNYMTWPQLKDLVAKGMEIGSHTRYHQYLAKENDIEKLKIEIIGSKEKLEQELGIKVVAFSYPFGSKNSTTTEMLKQAGYLSARDIVNGRTQTLKGLYSLKGYFVTSDFERFKWILGLK
ncbi:MAG: polysaccharide deacetylase family protein [Candidatus Buchananbacteria bacterium]